MAKLSVTLNFGKPSNEGSENLSASNEPPLAQWRPIAGTSVLLGRLAEQKRHPVAFANRLVFRIVETRIGWLATWSRLQGGRQGPHAERVVLRVLWVGIEF